MTDIVASVERLLSEYPTIRITEVLELSPKAVMVRVITYDYSLDRPSNGTLLYFDGSSYEVADPPDLMLIENNLRFQKNSRTAGLDVLVLRRPDDIDVARRTLKPITQDAQLYDQPQPARR